MERLDAYKYFAFISYKSEDEKWAVWLQKRLERYSLPVSLQKKNGLPRKLSPIFRDGTDILPKELKTELDEKLEQSEYLIVLCSPRSAASEWVGEEIQHFCANGRRDRVIAVIIDGTPYSNNPATECYNSVIKEWFPKGDTPENDHQLLGADIHSFTSGSNYYKKERAFVQVVATMLQLPFDALWNRRRRQLIMELAVSFCITIAMATAVLFTWMSGLPFDTNVTLEEHTPHNPDLPFRDATLTLVSDMDTLGIRSIINSDETVSFGNIPGKFKGKETHIIMDAYGFFKTDTLVHLTKDISIRINRDSTFSVFAGHVRMDDGITPVCGVNIEIEGRSAITDENGYFIIRFPITEQSLCKQLVLSKNGFVSREFSLQPQKDHQLVIFLK